MRKPKWRRTTIAGLMLMIGATALILTGLRHLFDDSRVYYVAGAVVHPGRWRITGNETVLDAINNSGGVNATGAFPSVWLVRPPSQGASGAQVLPVNLAAIVRTGDPTTNYQLRPGDRLIVRRSPAAMPVPAQAIRR